MEAREKYDSLAKSARRLLADTEQQLFVGSDQISASAALTRHISEEARQAHVFIEHVETALATTITDDLISIDVALRGESDLEGVLTFIHAIEYGEKILTIPAIRIEAAAASDSTRDVPSVLGFNATIRGYVLLRSISPTASSGL